MRRNRLRALAALVLFFALGPASGCFGGFNLTRSLYRSNEHVEGKWPRDGLFVVLVPVYLGAVIVDMFFLNTVEFFSDHNPIEVVDDDDTAP